MFTNTITNTLVISLYTIAVTFPLPIILALMCNQMYARRFKKFFQVSTYLPHFISTVVMCGMIIMFLSPSSGVIPKICSMAGITTGDLMGNAGAFSSIYVWTEVWQHVGWDSIMYIAALSAVDPQLYEAADVDGASKWQKVLAIDIPDERSFMHLDTVMTQVDVDKFAVQDAIMDISTIYEITK